MSKKSQFLSKVEAHVAVIAMSNLRPEDTGIPGVVIWVSAGEFEGKKGQHGPRVKVILGGGKVTQESLAAAPSVTIADGKVVRGKLTGKVLKQVRDFLELNREVLLQYWNQDIGTIAMGNGIREID